MRAGQNGLTFMGKGSQGGATQAGIRDNSKNVCKNVVSRTTLATRPLRGRRAPMWNAPLVSTDHPARVD